MATYVIGDIHGCFAQLQLLLELIKFDKSKDTLWFTGDLINGGPQPAETLRFIKSLGDKQVCVLGNHDLVLLGTAVNAISVPNDRHLGFEPVLEADDRNELLAWLKMRPIVHFDPHFNVLLVHAGVLPQWSLQQIQAYAHEVESIIRGQQSTEFYGEMYGNLPALWSDDLTGWPRIRCLVNCFTRMRFCTPQGKLDLTIKGPIEAAPNGCMPWFKIPTTRDDNVKILFGHWASLMGHTGEPDAIALDTGCVWGKRLTALRLDDWQFFSVANNK